MPSSKNKSKIYKAIHELKQRVGCGPIDTQAIERAQNAMDNNKIDFSPMGLDFLANLEKSLNSIEANLDDRKTEQQMKMLIAPVMELKANAAIFHYALVGNLANIMLSFLESIKKLDKDALSIVRGHHDSLKLILSSKMEGDGGKNGQIMETELKDACARYYKKKKKQE